MFFLNFWYFWFLPLIAIPFLLNLWKRRRVTIVSFPYFSFLMESKIRNVTFFKILNVLLLILRIASILILIIFMSRPIRRHASSGSIHTELPTVFILDNSLSMSVPFRQSSPFKQSQTLIEQSVLEFSRDVPCALITMNEQGNLALIDSRGTPERLLSTLKSTAVVPYQFDVHRSIHAAETFLNSLPDSPKNIVIYTDNQRRNWTNISPVTIADSHTIRFVTPQSLPAGGLGWIGISDTASVTMQNEHGSIYPVIQNFGADDPIDYICTFIIDNETVANIYGESLPDTTSELPMQYHATLDKKFLQAQFSFEYGDFSIDNQLYAALPVYPVPRLFICGDDTSAFFLKNALSPYFIDSAFADSPPLYHLTQEQAQNKGISPSDILFYCTASPDTLPDWIKRAVANGTTAIIFYATSSISDQNQQTQVSSVNFAHPLFRLYSSMGQKTFEEISCVPQHDAVFLPDITKRTQLLTTEENTPFMEELGFYDGRFFVFYSDAAGIASTLVTSDVFLPLLHTLIDHALTESSHPPSYYTRHIGSKMSLEDDTPFSVQWIQHKGESYRLASVFMNGKYRIDILPVTAPGFYTLRRDNTESLFAFNVPVSEGDLNAAADAVIRNALPGNAPVFSPLFELDSAQSGLGGLGKIQLLIISCVVISLIELLIANTGG